MCEKFERGGVGVIVVTGWQRGDGCFLTVDRDDSYSPPPLIID